MKNADALRRPRSPRGLGGQRSMALRQKRAVFLALKLGINELALHAKRHKEC